jgi:class 3 adenylate cyclase
VAACAQCGAELPSEARFCPACAAPVDRRFEPAGERKVATILFADLVGSTALGGSQDAERTRAMLDRFYDAMATEIERAGGTVEKFVGDAVMAAFGAPAAHEDDAERALHVALAMQRRLGELFESRFALRIGVNTGDVVLGAAREGSSFVTGDAVNVCARLEQAAAPGDILVGERTVAAARGAFEFEELQTVEAKGKPEGVVCRKLVRALSLMRPRGVAGLEPVFVGRESELERLETAYQRVTRDGRGQLLTILGDAGVGKTRLLRELWQRLSGRSPQPLLRTGRCLSYGEGITYWPLGEVLKEHFGILESDSPEAIAARLGDREALGFTLGLAPPPEMHPLTVRDRLHTGWVELLQEFVDEQPVTLLVEDLHWAEPDLCILLESLVERVHGPLLLLTTARPELLDRRPDLGDSIVHLDALRPAETGVLLEALLGAECPPALRELVAEHAEGNPFFVEELIATFVDRGVLARQNGGWSFGELPPGFSVPDSVQAVLAARIDLLPPREKSALQAAAVIGRAFWADPVRELLEGEVPDLTLLEERDFVRRRAGSSLAGEQEYVIKHALTREVAYGSLLKAKRAPLHAGFAEWLERRGEGEDEHAPLLAHHYGEAVRPEDVDLAWSGREDEAERLRVKAVAWSTRAAELAVGRYEIEEGLSLLHRALELEPDRVRQADLWERIARASALKFDGEAFWRSMEQAIELAGPRPELYAELALQSVWRAGMWVQEPAWDRVEDWANRALAAGAEGSLVQGKALVAIAQIKEEEAEAPAQAALAIAERLENLELRALALMALASAAWSRGELDEACERLECELRAFELTGDPDGRAKGLLGGVFLYLHAGRIAAARETAEVHAEVVAGLTPHHRMHGAGLPVLVETLAGDWDATRRLSPGAERAVEANLRAGTPCPMNVAILLNCAVASSIAGDEKESRRLEAKADAIGMVGYRGWFEPVRLRLALARRDLNAVRALVPEGEPNWLEPPGALLDSLVALGDRERIEAEAPKWLRPGTYVEPFALRALGLAREDETLVERAAQAFDTLGLAWHAHQTRERKTTV